MISSCASAPFRPPASAHTIAFRTLSAVLAIVVVGMLVQPAAAQLCVQLNGSQYRQDFNSLAVSGSSNNSSTIPIGFAFSESGTGNNVTYAANDGSSSTANSYSFGTGTNTDRALGELGGAVGGVQSILGACFVNNTGFVITSFSLGYTGEVWRLGAADGNLDRLDFQFSTTATSLTNGTVADGTWTEVNSLDFATPIPINTGTAGAKDGNAAPNRTVKGPIAIIPAGGLPFASTMFIRWVPADLGTAEDGLAIDDFTLSYAPMADFDLDRDVDGNDFLRLQRGTGTKVGASISSGDANKDGAVDLLDWTIWRSMFGTTADAPGLVEHIHVAAIPEPTSMLQLVLAAFLATTDRRRRSAVRRRTD
jgi:hypothetical protein